MRFNDVHKKARHVKKACEPRDNEDDVDGFQVQMRHGANLAIEGRGSKFLEGNNGCSELDLAFRQSDEVLSEENAIIPAAV